MKRKIFNISFIIMVFLLFLSCSTLPKVKPSISQTVITIQRYPTKTDARKPMEIYVDDKKLDYTIKNGESVSVPVNDGVHTIYVKIGRNESEVLNFTAAQKTVSFLASVDREGNVIKKTKVVLSRARVSDDTGSTTDKPVQEDYIPQE
jgi:predicted nucleic acid-binding Zn finger protein